MNWVEVENVVVEETGLRNIHLMANAPFGYGPPSPALRQAQGGEDDPFGWIDAYLVPEGAKIAVTKENGAFHLRGEWPYRGALDVQCEGWPQFKRFVCWALKGERVSKAMREGTLHYSRIFGRYPGTAFIRQMPKDVEEGVEVDGVALLCADWAPQGCLLIGG